MDTPDGLISALVLDGNGGARVTDAAGVDTWSADDGPLWLHLERKHPRSECWLREDSGLSGLVVDALLADDARPRCTPHSGGLVVVLRGVNLNPGAEPDDMISLRLWIDTHRVISLRSPRLLAAQDLREQLDTGDGPRTTGDLLAALTAALTERIAPVVSALDDRIDDMEEALLDLQTDTPRLGLTAARRQAIALSRYLGPQREALLRLAETPGGPLAPDDRAQLRESANRTIRYVEDLSAHRERAVLIQEELHTRQSDRINRTMYVLSMVTAIFLPLGLITGLLGINVGGVPGVDSPAAFAWVCGALVVLGALQFLVLKWWKLL